MWSWGLIVKTPFAPANPFVFSIASRSFALSTPPARLIESTTMKKASKQKIQMLDPD